MLHTRLGIAAVTAVLIAAITVADAPASVTGGPTGVPSSAAAPALPAVVSIRIIGHSVRGRPIRAYELGVRGAGSTVVALGSMHGNEQDGSVLISRLINGSPITGAHLWVIPRDNPDGFLRNVRHNARGVDLNRNFPARWTRVTGYYDSGPRPSSEPETRALKRFLNQVNPGHVVTFHSPLRGIDVYGAKDRPFARRLSVGLKLPTKSFDCSGSCHGTLTQWFNRSHQGACVTVEFGSDPSRRYLNVRAPRGFLRAIGGTR
ncbi:MAG: M14 family zinc carboxypeptidase [Nocardioidaceae bacterium]